MILTQITEVLSKGNVSAIMTTRNGIYRTVGGEDGNPNTGKYEIKDWDDANELLWLKTREVTNPHTMVQREVAISYGIIDEIEIIPTP
jgi:hypothetical protein